MTSFAQANYLPSDGLTEKRNFLLKHEHPTHSRTAPVQTSRDYFRNKNHT